MTSIFYGPTAEPLNLAPPCATIHYDMTAKDYVVLSVFVKKPFQELNFHSRHPTWNEAIKALHSNEIPPSHQAS